MEINKIYCADNLIFMSDMIREDIKADLVLIDPPYNVGKDFGNDTDRQTNANYIWFMGERAKLLKRVLSQKGNIICFASQKNVAQIQIILERYEMCFQRLMIWHYRNGMSRQEKSPVTEFEPFLWHSQDQNDWVYNGDDVRVPYKSERVKNPVYKKNKDGEKIAWMPDPRGAKRGDVWEYPTLAGKLYENEKTEHPSQKPEALIIDLIKAFCPKNSEGKYNGVILDVFAGSGTVPVCCEHLNRHGHNIKWLACELEQKWVDIGRRRIEKLSETYESIL